MLHLISQATVDDAILQRIGCGDIVVLLDGAVLKTLSQGGSASAFLILLVRARCCVLVEHLQLYGIAEADLVEGIEVIDYAGLVNLTLAEPLIQSWH
jgi:tRNA 2-thiouridine synthesizing protein B